MCTLVITSQKRKEDDAPEDEQGFHYDEHVANEEDADDPNHAHGYDEIEEDVHAGHYESEEEEPEPPEVDHEEEPAPAETDPEEAEGPGAKELEEAADYRNAVVEVDPALDTPPLEWEVAEKGALPDGVPDEPEEGNA